MFLLILLLGGTAAINFGGTPGFTLPGIRPEPNPHGRDFGSFVSSYKYRVGRDRTSPGLFAVTEVLHVKPNLKHVYRELS